MHKRHALRSMLWAASSLALVGGCSPEPELSDAEALPLVTQEQGERAYDPGPGWNLAWQDDFTGNSLNSANWTVLTSNFDPVTNNCNFGTGELEFPRAQNVTVAGGKLILTAQRTADAPFDSRCAGYGPRSYYSGRIHSKGKVERRYGKLVASIKVPSGYGMWPAFWTLGANISNVGWPRSGEIDILEWHSNDASWMKSAAHWFANGAQQSWGTGANRGYSIADGFHTYEVEWTANRMIFRLDGEIRGNEFAHNEAAFQQNHYILLNLALGGNWYGHPHPDAIGLPWGQTKTMEVEWVRWYQPGSTPPPASLTNASFENGMTGWATWSPNGTEAADFSETYNGGRTGAYHLTHWTNGTPFEVWTYQPVPGLASGTYKVRAWVRKSGGFDLSRLQAKTCGECAPVFTNLGNHGDWTMVETPPISVTGGYLELGFHTRATSGNSANFIHMDDVELIRL
ncbi:glycosyl hydrolase, family 16 [Myxococcus xanthus DK 1622]|uniref:Glycosyl hydrolase, family 16 n=1 Tax=Myxococcus xanthus (strain DK1622) TaxID=246197 RepID=Q1D2Z5_MYXXD|nr:MULTISPECIES: glycoside hydrolase family 16 protein [Myxococcus]ABF93028.1 glycosyl hydrolase, family 16 [Myxococcus xanthus DK 1622]UYI12210.1 glycoside hydrolase family 16 protein [Myxococcus xanthus]UYI19579.1 glycoside hydrolase family 16 protein [Myxococcus xanthus]